MIAYKVTMSNGDSVYLPADNLRHAIARTEHFYPEYGVAVEATLDKEN